MGDSTVRVEGLQDLRKSLRAMDREALKTVQATTKRAAAIVAEEAGRLAPRGTRPIPPSRRPQVRLADSYRATTKGSSGVVRSPLPYAPIVEYRRTGTAAQMRNTRPVSRALEAKERAVMDELADGFDRLAKDNGWR